MVESFLQLQYQDDRDGTGKLLVHAQDNAFRGSSEAWFGEEELLSFGKALASTYPLQHDQEISIRAGAPYANKNALETQQVYVSLAFYPIGVAGKIGVRIDLATTLYEGERPKSQRSLGIELVTRYGALQEFGNDIIKLIKGSVQNAKLSTSVE